MFQHCQLGYVGAGMGAFCIGLSAAEITAAMDALGIPQPRRKALLGDAIYMGSAAAEWINEQNRKAAG